MVCATRPGAEFSHYVWSTAKMDFQKGNVSMTILAPPAWSLRRKSRPMIGDAQRGRNSWWFVQRQDFRRFLHR